MRKYGTSEKVEEVKTTPSALEIVSAHEGNPVVLAPIEPVGSPGRCDDPNCPGNGACACST